MTAPARGAFRVTIALGILFGVCLAPLTLGLSALLSPPLAFRLVVWGYLAVYGALLARWGEAGVGRILLPLISLLGISVIVESRTEALAAALLVLGWMRSGARLGTTPWRALAGEILIGWGGGFAVVCFQPATIWSWSLAVWLFFLVQSLYFPLFLKTPESAGDADSPDTFERARRDAEKILAA